MKKLFAAAAAAALLTGLTALAEGPLDIGAPARQRPAVASLANTDGLPPGIAKKVKNGDDKTLPPGIAKKIDRDDRDDRKDDKWEKDRNEPGRPPR